MTTTKPLRLFSSESVTIGHPDKICDQVSDAILDALLTVDPDARVAVEALTTTGLMQVAGEVTTKGYVEIPQIVRSTLLGIGYDSSANGFDGARCGVSISIGQQSPDIAGGVFNSLEARSGADDPREAQGAGDQGIMFGYATNETDTYMPTPIALAHRLSAQLTEVRQDGIFDYLRPDGKTQVTIGYDGDRPVSLETVVVSTQHTQETAQQQLHADISEGVIAPVIADSGLEVGGLEEIINPSGPFVVGGPVGDAGLTGRKIIVDTYGGFARHGGGAFSGKDPSKVDRSATYAMRWVAKNVVAAGLADRAEIQIAYAIGRAHPVGIYVETFGTEHVNPDAISTAIREVFDLRPLGIIEDLDLKRPIYAETAKNGHFGRSEFPWEQLNRVDALRSYFGA
ncbi:methionine adenosyltransferase [Nesterenkonia natronophila]|uniref:S-adenosylmethionine synthase n=1 Tax=Nesterenkonia natronophila TaxID=2174932 RepID=A0A3A4FYN3_9MICC|nr:methionine adenosyltransferase [Nesterenkonia natronophila]RJN31149.1 methionine adenosyltransferase [Nesterenkonia natronophila]